MKLLVLKDERDRHILGVTYKGLVYTNTESIISVFEKVIIGVLDREGIINKFMSIAKRYEVGVDKKVSFKSNLRNNIYFIEGLRKIFKFANSDSEEDDEFAIKNIALKLLYKG